MWLYYNVSHQSNQQYVFCTRTHHFNGMTFHIYVMGYASITHRMYIKQTYRGFFDIFCFSFSIVLIWLFRAIFVTLFRSHSILTLSNIIHRMRHCTLIFKYLLIDKRWKMYINHAHTHFWDGLLPSFYELCFFFIGIDMLTSTYFLFSVLRANNLWIRESCRLPTLIFSMTINAYCKWTTFILCSSWSMFVCTQLSDPQKHNK